MSLAEEDQIVVRLPDELARRVRRAFQEQQEQEGGEGGEQLDVSAQVIDCVA